MIKRARELHIGVMVGSMNESTIGSSAIVHLQSMIDYLDADGPLLLKEDIATGLRFQPDGKVVTSGEPGLGVRFCDMYQKDVQ